jgi:hypothetical protein
MLIAMDTEPFDSDALESRWAANERELKRIRNMPRLVRELHAANAERLAAEQDSIESRLFDRSTQAGSNCASFLPHGRQRPYLPPPEEIEVLKRQIRAENESRESPENGPPNLNMYRQPRVGRTNYSQGRIGNY